MDYDVDDWLRTHVFPNGRPASLATELMAGKFLERYALGQPIGDPENFVWMTLEMCLSATVEIAARVAADAEQPLRSRCTAMTQLILLSINSAAIHLDFTLIKTLLAAQIEDRPHRYEIVRLVRAVLLQRRLWTAMKAEVRTALTHAYQEIGIPLPSSLQTKGFCTAALRQIERLP